MAFWDLARKSLVIGVVSDAPLVLAAIGFALLYRLTGLINVAYSETVTMGAYLGMWVNTTFELNFYVTLIPTALLTGLFSVLTYFAIFRPAKQRNVGVVETIIISFGLSIFLRYGLQFIFGFEFRYYDVPIPKSLSVLGVGVSPFRLTALGTTLALALLLIWFIRKSRLGVQIRALAGDEKLAQVSGINPLAITVLIWFIAGMAGGAGRGVLRGEHLLPGVARVGPVPLHPAGRPHRRGQGDRRGHRRRAGHRGRCSPSWSWCRGSTPRRSTRR